MITTFILLFVISIFAGILGALVGIGGGIIIVPALTLMMGLPVHQAIAASLVSVIATSIAGAHSYVEQRITNLKLGMFLEVSTTLGALMGAALALILTGWILSIIFGVLVLSMSIYSYLTRNSEDHYDYSNNRIDPSKKLESYLNIQGSFHDLSLDKEISYVVHKPWAGSLVSLIAGLGSGLLGIGGGVIKVTSMNAIMKVPMKVSVATSKFMIGVTAATSSVLYLISGVINFYLVAPVALGTMAGATFGSSFMNKIKSKHLKLIFTIVAGYLSIRMIMKGLSDGHNFNLF